MKKMTFSIFVILLAALVHCSEKKIPDTGIVTFLKGEAFVTKQGKKSALKFGEEIISGDLIETGNASVVIVTFAAGESAAEIQSNSKFYISLYNDKKADLELQSGNVWFAVNQKGKKDFSLTSPTAVAGVRGTKFFTFQVDAETFGTCHCEGKVHYTVKENNEATDNVSDHMVVVRKGKSITIEPEEYHELFPGNSTNHAHSEIETSTLGKARNVSPEYRKKLFERIESKFAAL
ncbi:FecR family protein [Leptospira ognonensis]|nr:FecR family protein [Leptospira ognonensis]